MCVNSCVKTRRSQSSRLPMKSDPAGQTAVTNTVSYGTGVANPFDNSRLIGEDDVRARRRVAPSGRLQRPPRVFRDRRQPRRPSRSSP